MVVGVFLFLLLDRLIKFGSLQPNFFYTGVINARLGMLFILHPSWTQWFSVSVLGVMGVCGVFLWISLDSLLKKKVAAPLLLILGGGASNVFDRFVYGGAIDMFSVPGFTIFNLSDIALLGGAFYLGVVLWHQKYIQERS